MIGSYSSGRATCSIDLVSWRQFQALSFHAAYDKVGNHDQELKIPTINT